MQQTIFFSVWQITLYDISFRKYDQISPMMCMICSFWQSTLFYNHDGKPWCNRIPFDYRLTPCLHGHEHNEGMNLIYFVVTLITYSSHRNSEGDKISKIKCSIIGFIFQCSDNCHSTHGNAYIVEFNMFWPASFSSGAADSVFTSHYIGKGSMYVIYVVPWLITAV